ncbi:hypothetical protein BD324DRAFT_648586 [Kockovaella imperatae]|uniref:Bromo domain-containing protein n=1 Tax=Kockovaella imperatae TaxID=4999 RepID=A0A1Y1UPN2_9TREE|nr:hypothetical protein BD324DRAFT_648586 [Kockovaella imperatae]ORX39969.1 hypothetical protein BD324DRAFT_648586 [Kockovaella imperatae]
MKYLLGFLEGISDGPDLADPEFQQLLVDVQAGKTQPKSADAFYESLEKIINELKSTPESLPFQKPVTRRDAPDYYEVIKKPMDLSTMLRNIKGHKYKSKAEFAADLNLIWDNCALYNHEGHPIRIGARFMKQKADHHLEFLADKNEAPQQTFILPTLSGSGISVAARQIAAAGPHAPSQPSPLREASQAPAADEDARGEIVDSTQGDSAASQSFRAEAGAGPQSNTATQEQSSSQGQEEAEASSSRRDPNLFSSTDSRLGVGRASSIGRITQASWPKLQTNLDTAPALIRTSNTMNQFFPISSTHLPGPSFSDKGKAKEVLTASTPPAWYPSTGRPDPADASPLEGHWWTAIIKDEAFVGGMPATPVMAHSVSPKVARIRAKKRRRVSEYASEDRNGLDFTNQGHRGGTPALESPRPVKLESLVHRSVDRLIEARKLMNQIQDFQRIELEGGILPPIQRFDEKLERERRREERAERRAREKVERMEARKRASNGGEMGEEEAVMNIRRSTAGLLAHAGFEGANEIALDTVTRLVIDHIRSLGRTFRLFLDGSSHDLTSEQMTLHVLHENGQIQLQDLEAHIKDDIEREGVKVAEMTRKVKQGYKDVTAAPVVHDDMMFAEDGEMLLDGNFAEELGEDFLGLREMGIDKEFGLSSLTVPSSLFHGRRKRVANADQYGSKQADYDYPPPPPFVPLAPSAISAQLPALLHAFYASRLESGLGIQEDDPFDHVHSQIGSMGQIVVKSIGVKKKRPEEVEKADQQEEAKKVKPKKPPKVGVGKGNWIRPPKHERDRRAAEKRAALERQKQLASQGNGDGVITMTEDVNGIAAAGDDDAEGEEE